MKLAAFWFIIVLAVEVLAVEPTSESLPTIPAAYIVSLSGPVLLLSNSGSTSQPLLPELDIGRALFAGQILRVSDGGSVELRMDEGIRKVSKRGDFAVPSSPSDRRSEAMKALESFFRPGGRTRSSASPLLYPTAESAVCAGSFEIRWDASRWEGMLTLAIADENGTEIWKRVEVPANAGILDPVDARRQLTELRQPFEGSQLTLAIRTNAGTKYFVSFYLLSQETEQKLERELGGWNATPDAEWVHHAARAATFLRYHLLNEAIKEYDRALVLTGESRAVLLAASEAYRRIGDLTRAKELSLRAKEKN
jgi:hypothetical protein